MAGGTVTPLARQDVGETVMGLFGKLFGGGKRTNVDVVPDSVWLTTDAKFSGLMQQAVERSRTDSAAILLVAHFRDVLARLEQLVDAKAWDVPCRAVHAEHLSADLAAALDLDETTTIDVIVAERHPLPSVDDRLEEFADGLPCRCRFAHHVSLDDAVIQVFAGAAVRRMLELAGMREDECVESKMVSRRIRQAQQKIEGQGFDAFDADSASQWLEKNCPGLRTA